MKNGKVKVLVVNGKLTGEKSTKPIDLSDRQMVKVWNEASKKFIWR